MAKLIRITTVPMALRYLLPGQLRYMKAQGLDVLLISADGPERAAVQEAEGCPHLIVPMTRKITPFKDLACLWQLIKIFRREKPDIVHTHTPKAGLLGMLAARLAGVKIRIHTVAGMPLMVEKGFKYHLLTVIEKLTYMAAGKVWPNSFSLLNFIKEHSLAPDRKLQVISRGSSNGIDLARFSHQALDPALLQQIKERIHFAPDLIYLLCVGRLVKDKGIAELVAGFAALQQQYSNLRLLLVGEYEEALDPLPAVTLAEIQTNPGIIHTGWDSRVEYYMALAHLFVFPSHREGFPNVLLQAGAMKIPVVCSAIPGNTDIADEKFTGLLFPAGNQAALQSQVAYALEKPEVAAELADMLYKKIQQFYGRENIWAAIHAEYVLLLNKL